MKILIISDTHGRTANLEKVLEIEKGLELLIHLGDLEQSEDYIKTIAGCPCEMVAGNNDYFSQLPREKMISVRGYKMLLTHGHYYNVSVELQTIVDEGVAREADVVMFGHIHRPVYEMIKGVLLLNPGSLSLPRQPGFRPSYMIMEIDRKREISCEIKYL